MKCAARAQTRPRQQGRFHLPSRAFIALHLLVVLVPFSVLAVWSVSASWPAPDLLPSVLSDKGFAEIARPSQHTPEVLATSIGIAIACAVLSTAIASLAAYALTNFRFRGRRIFQFAGALPFLIPSTVFGMGVQVAFIKLGLARGIVGVTLAHCIIALPYAIVIMTDVARAAGTRLPQAAQTLGVTPVQAALHVTLPRLAPGIVSALTMTYIVSFSQYFLTLLIGGGAVRTFILDMFPYLASGDRTVASAYGMVFLLVTLAVFALMQLALRHWYRAEGQDYFGS